MSVTRLGLLNPFLIAVSLNAPTLLGAGERIEPTHSYVCNDHIGQRALILDTSEYSGPFRVYVAGVRYLETAPISIPAIILDMKKFKAMSSLEKQFTLAHECYHLASGDAYHTYEMLSFNIKVPKEEDISMELDADCHAAKKIRELGIYTYANYSRLKYFISSYTSSSRLNERLTNLQRCLT